MNLYHYYNRNTKPFMNLSDLAIEEANFLLDQIRLTKPASFCAQRPSDYMKKRLYYERILREEFQKKGGRIVRNAPHYMIVEQSAWLSSWYDDCAYIKIPIEEFDIRTLSFTYGDSHPTFSDRVNDGKEYWKKLYTYDEILGIIDKYGLPQDWNSDGAFGPERYIEVHIWSDETIERYR
ncbi:MAG: hypothetical protein J6K48_06975 [Lachnospiraceae bacterium]|nr:hypothetical protein [Lachnospiraceae bacterium]